MRLQPGQLLPRHLTAWPATARFLLGLGRVAFTFLQLLVFSLRVGVQSNYLLPFPLLAQRGDNAWSLCMLLYATFLLQPTSLLCNFYIQNFNVDDQD